MRKRIVQLASAFAVLACLAAAPMATAAGSGAVDLNTATEEELVALPGIGPSKAKAILEYRGEHPFASVEDLMNVRGIGEHTFESLKDKVRVGSAETESAKR